MENNREKLRNSRNIAVVRTDKLGDMVLTLPMVNALKEFCPNSHIDFIASSYTEVLLHGQNLINNYHFIDKTQGGINQIFRSNSYDAVFFPRPRFDEIFSAFRHRIPLRVGSAYRIYSFLLNHKVYQHRKIAEQNEAQYNVDLINSITGLSHQAKLLKPIIPNGISIDNIYTSQSSDRIKIIIHPGGGGSAPKWSASNYGNLAKLLIDNDFCDIIITGTQDESALADIVQSISGNRAINLCGKLSLEQMMLLISQSECLVANSTGVLHIAAALGIKVMGFYPNTPSMSSKRWGALTDKSEFLYPPPSNNPEESDDLNRISVDMAYSSLKRLLNRSI